MWAPEVIAWGNGDYRLYYTTRAPRPDIQCVSVAVGSSPAGPFTDSSTRPIVCEDEIGGSIDASPFIAPDGTRYLYWKNDGNAVGEDTWISVARLSKDGLSLVGKPTQLIKQTEPWEGQLVEAPFVWEHDSTYHLFYSANSFGEGRYAVRHATAASPIGPFTKDPDPLLVTNDVAVGPGHCALIEVNGQVGMINPAWPPGAIGAQAPGRQIWLSKVSFEGERVHVEPPATAISP